MCEGEHKRCRFRATAINNHNQRLADAPETASIVADGERRHPFADLHSHCEKRPSRRQRADAPVDWQCG
jgi:hypothetical protein